MGAVLFHRYSDGSERPIANTSKTLISTQCGYSQIQKEALAIIFALNKFHQFLYGRTFILVTDHKPLIAVIGPTKATQALAANRLARWALMLSTIIRLSIRKRQTMATRTLLAAFQWSQMSTLMGRKVMQTWTLSAPSRLSAFS